MRLGDPVVGDVLVLFYTGFQVIAHALMGCKERIASIAVSSAEQEGTGYVR